MNIYEYVLVTKRDEDGNFEFINEGKVQLIAAENVEEAKLSITFTDYIDPEEVDIIVHPFC